MHRAELFGGTVVAVKVRRPGVVDTVARDFALLEKVLDTFAKDGLGGIDIKALILELEKTSKIELDFTNEAVNLERFLANNEGRAGIESPKCYREFTNEAILTEDFVTGHEVGDTAYLDTLDDDERERIAALVADNFASQVLVDGYYHADPHSGNVLIKEAAPVEAAAETEGNADAAGEDKLPLPDHGVEWIDFGMMGQLTAQQRQILLDLVTAVVMQDAYSLKRTVLKAAQPVGEIDHGAMLEKGQIGVRTDFSFEEKALGSVERLVGYAVRALMVVALFIGSCLLCTVSPSLMETTPLFFTFPVVGSIGYVVSVFFAWRLYKSMKKDK